eukprot:TRINITY_DN4781_c0_g1_i2.p1 TRINITY_DN4781_c0_g1~~TRINITY_DN4781_c0_g1_i2.p1  ORF type:complete len:1030 (+),score=187.45 TRINITY_DN4781_c0_g1_i2:218-3091(+)
MEVILPSKDSREVKLFPWECRQSADSYTSILTLSLAYQINNEPKKTHSIDLGRIPIMLKSSGCRLNGLTKEQLVRMKEEPDELGGYFILKGNEKLIRMVVAPRRNYPMILSRSAYAKYGQNFTNHLCSIRCVSSSETCLTVYYHFLTDGNVVLRFRVQKSSYIIPVVLLLKALLDSVSDRELFETVLQKFPDKPEVAVWCENMIRSGLTFGCYTKEQYLSVLGSQFRIVMEPYLPRRMTDIEVGEFLISNLILIHLPTNEEKFNLCVFIIQKLYAYALGDVLAEDSDRITSHEVITAGIIFQQYSKALIDQWMTKIRSQFKSFVTDQMGEKRQEKKDTKKEDKTDDKRADDAEEMVDAAPSKPKKLPFTNMSVGATLKKSLDKTKLDLGMFLQSLMKTGNIRAVCENVQTAGWAVVVDRINHLRFLSNFRAVHRGQFFTNVRVTSVRKLNPESWGFLCPVHTPDGGPCGLLNHLAAESVITTRDEKLSLDTLCGLGMSTIKRGATFPPSHLTVLLNGSVVGSVRQELVQSFVSSLRRLKTQDIVPKMLEIAAVNVPSGNLYPGIYLATHKMRFMRSVKNLEHSAIEYIGPLEQVYLGVACRPEDVRESTSHIELRAENILDFLACMTPFSDFNQSPRNMYQCQMAKQTLGTANFSLKMRTDNTAYQITTPQKPLVRTEKQIEYEINEKPQGTNAVVAVISYTGYDMEDAMIINKGSFERGFGHGTVYKTTFYESYALSGKDAVFANSEGEVNSPADLHEPSLDADGLPMIGDLLKFGETVVVTYDRASRAFHKKKFAKEFGYVDKVIVMATELKGGKNYITKVAITVRIPRPPTIGDKFSSRHGQKGVLSVLWPQENMPFSETGMTPDVIINPHAFPSRMTIGMLIESMAGKSASIHGHFPDATPFRFNENSTAVDFFGEQLAKAGYNYYGNETMYSGTYGTEFPADIYLGVRPITS